MKRPTKKFALKLMNYIVLSITMIWIYIPAIVGIIVPMVYMLPIAYTSWVLFASVGTNNWVDGWIVINPSESVVLIVFEFLLYGLGLILLIWGVIAIAKIRRNQQGLAIWGPYKYLRHPQHLGLILISLATSLYVPFTTDKGIRLGEILSWSLFSIILFIISDIEDRKLAKKFGQEYLDYHAKTSSFFPCVFNKGKQRILFKNIIYWKRYLLILIGYLIFIYHMYLSTLPSVGIWSYTL
ncbi:MAG: methyltransferase family protein [Candidatus Heimdallarchaeaceae archaeon]